MNRQWLNDNWMLCEAPLTYTGDKAGWISSRKDGWHTGLSLPCDVHQPLIAAGIKGIEDKLELEPPFVGDAYITEQLREIPKTLRDATDWLRRSTMLAEAFGADVVSHYVHTAEWEQFEYDRRVTDWELKRGFERS